MLASSKYAHLLQASICFALATIICVGCGKPKTEPVGTTPAETTETPATETSSLNFQSTDQAKQTLAGLWLGKAAFNQEALKNVIAQTPESEQEALLKEAQTFASTQMALQFSADGVMKSAVEVTPVGAQPIQGQTVAQWNVTDVRGNQVLVQSTLKNSEGKDVTIKSIYLVSPDGNRIVLRANLSSKLAQCEPLIYLDRQVNKRLAEAPATDNPAR